MKRTVVRIRPRLVNVWLHVAPVVSVPESKRLAFVRPLDRPRMVAPCRRASCRYAWRLDRGADRVEVPEPRGLWRPRPSMVEVAGFREELHESRRVRRR